MADVVEIKKKKPEPRRAVRVCWGGYNTCEVAQFTCKTSADVGIRDELLIVSDGDGSLWSFPIGSVFYWNERDEK